jgi:hypothetical protein
MIYWAMEGIKNADYYSFLGQGFQDGTVQLFRMEPEAMFSRPSTSLPQKRPLDAKCEVGSANGIRTRVTAVRGRCPRPLDDSAGEPCF